MGPEKLIGYPLAFLGSFALLAQPPATAGGLGGVEGAGGNQRLQSRPNSTLTPPLPASTVSPPAVPAPPGRPSAESAELRALRMDESSLFPELGQSRLDLYGSVPNPASCDTPDYDLAKSVEVDIPAAGDWLHGLKRPDIAVPRDPKVARYIRYFAATPRGRETFATWLRRSGAYREVVHAALGRRKLPNDLIAVMFVESGCWPKAVSSAGAAGLWQFMPQTAQAYGLDVRPGFDERRNIWKSTEAAVTHLADLHSQFQSWHLALAAYNVGYQQLLNRLQTTRTEDFFTLSKIPEGLPRETALYVPKILAVAVLLRNLEYFGFDGVETLTPVSASRIEVPPNTRMSLIARAAGTSEKRLRELNPQILGESTPDAGSPVFVHLPNSGLARAKTMLPRLLAESDRGPLDLAVTSDFDWGRDELDANWRSRLERTKPGYSESESDERKDRQPKPEEHLAGRTGEPVARASQHRDATGDDQEPVKTYNGSSIEAARGRDEPKNRCDRDGASCSNSTFYRIKPGDTLSELAESFRVPLRQLADANNLTNPYRILAGSRLRVASNTSNEKR